MILDIRELWDDVESIKREIKERKTALVLINSKYATLIDMEQLFKSNGAVLKTDFTLMNSYTGNFYSNILGNMSYSGYDYSSVQII